MTDLLHLIVELDERVAISSHPEEWLRFMLRCAELLAPFLPDVGMAALESAKRNFNGQGRKGELEQAERDCWAFYNALPPDVREREKRAIAVRAVVMVLFPDFSEDNGLDLMEMFIGFLRRVDDFSCSEIQILREVFEPATKLSSP